MRHCFPGVDSVERVDASGADELGIIRHAAKCLARCRTSWARCRVRDRGAYLEGIGPADTFTTMLERATASPGAGPSKALVAIRHIRTTDTTDTMRTGSLRCTRKNQPA